MLLHLDVDCLDITEGHANEYASPGGLSGADLLACLGKVLAQAKPLALTVASYDPSQPGADRVGKITLNSIDQVVRTLR